MSQITKYKMRSMLRDFGGSQTQLNQLDFGNEEIRRELLELLYDGDYELVMSICMLINRNRLFFAVDAMIDYCVANPSKDDKQDLIYRLLRDHIFMFGEYGLHRLIVYYVSTTSWDKRNIVLLLIERFTSLLVFEFQAYAYDIVRLLYEGNLNPLSDKKIINRMLNNIDK